MMIIFKRSHLNRGMRWGSMLSVSMTFLMTMSVSFSMSVSFPMSVTMSMFTVPIIFFRNVQCYSAYAVGKHLVFTNHEYQTFLICMATFVSNLINQETFVYDSIQVDCCYVVDAHRHECQKNHGKVCVNQYVSVACDGRPAGSTTTQQSMRATRVNVGATRDVLTLRAASTGINQSDAEVVQCYKARKQEPTER